jgi:RND family efflux transporter MFP subunit
MPLSRPARVRHTRRLPSALSLAGLLALFGCAPHKPPAPPPPTVSVAAPLSMTIVDWDDYDGQFIAVDSVDIRPRVSGYLLKVGFKDGDMVRKGQLLFQIDPRPYQAALDQAKGAQGHSEAALVNAQEQLARGRTLVGAHAISQQAFELLEAAQRQAVADLEASKASVAAQALNVQFTRVTAPLSGRVSDRRVAPGNLVTADTTVLTNITSLDPIWFQFTGSEALYLKYQHEAQNGTRPSSRSSPTPVEIQLQDEPTYRWHGRVDFVDNQIDPSSGAIRQRAVVDNPGDFLTPGMFGHLRLAGSGAYPALLVPDTVISNDLNQRVVLVVGPGNIVAERAVTLGPLYRGLRVIRSGVRPTDLVIIDRIQSARVGAKIDARRGSIQPGPAPTAGGGQPAYADPVPTAASPAAEVAAPR